MRRTAASCTVGKKWTKLAFSLWFACWISRKKKLKENSLINNLTNNTFNFHVCVTNNNHSSINSHVYPWLSLDLLTIVIMNKIRETYKRNWVKIKLWSAQLCWVPIANKKIGPLSMLIVRLLLFYITRIILCSWHYIIQFVFGYYQTRSLFSKVFEFFWRSTLHKQHLNSNTRR